MMKVYPAELYALGKHLSLCIYQPEFDMHFPLSTPSSSRWRIVTWCIIETKPLPLTYAVFLSRRLVGQNSEEAGLDTMDFETQFDTVTVLPRRVGDISSISEDIFMSVLPTLLRALGSEDDEATLSTLPFIIQALQKIDNSEFLIGRQTGTSPANLCLNGLVPAGKVLSIEEQASQLNAIDAVSFDWQQGAQTNLQFVRPLPLGRALLLDHGSYHLVLIA